MEIVICEIGKSTMQGLLEDIQRYAGAWRRAQEEQKVRFIQHESRLKRLEQSVKRQVTGMKRRVNAMETKKNESDNKWMTGDAIAFSHLSGKVIYIPKNVPFTVNLNSLEYEVFTLVPVKELRDGVKFAPIGLINSRGVVNVTEWNCCGPNASTDVTNVNMKVFGCGKYAAYSSVRPKLIAIDSHMVEFSYDQESGLVTIELKVPEVVGLCQWVISFYL
ncbi:probable galactinol--sucrose galactosyltransferase 1 isoform X2 [Cicer arietinum]|uniref:probable galactinol--sucrose galactosyltransferase 1 isoform X2 n=1 Tax=Cicer arietinum TaxID=3827 RepID=UPI003CC55D6A